MTSFVMKITDIGMQKIANAVRVGATVSMTHMALGDGTYTPDFARTQLANERQRFPISDSETIGNDHIRVAGLADGDSAYLVSEAGVFLDDGTLFAIWSDPAKILGQKVAGGTFTPAFDLVFDRVDAGSITITTSGPPLNLFLAGPLAQSSAAAITAMNLVLQLKFAQQEA